MDTAVRRLALFVLTVGCIIACDNPVAPKKKLTPPPPDTSRTFPHDTLKIDTTGHG